MHIATPNLSFREQLFLAAPVGIPLDFTFDEERLPKPPTAPPDLSKLARIRSEDRSAVQNWHHLGENNSDGKDNTYTSLVKRRYPKLYAAWTAYWQARRAYRATKSVAEAAQWRWFWADTMLAQRPNLPTYEPACSSTTTPVWRTDVNSAELKALLQSVAERVGPAQAKGSTGGRIMRRADGSTVSMFNGRSVYEPPAKIRLNAAEVAAHAVHYRKTRPDKHTPLSVRYGGLIFAVGNRETVKKLTKRLEKAEEALGESVGVIMLAPEPTDKVVT